jgi:ankyrin repeat protein
MKRARTEIITSGSSKRCCDNEALLKKSIDDPHFKTFETIIREDTTRLYINNGFNKEHLFFLLLNKIDSLRSDSNKNRDNNELIEKNNNAIQELHLCLNEVVRHKCFNSECFSSDGRPALRFFIDRSFTALYCTDTEKNIKSVDEHFLFLNVLKKKKALVNQKYKNLTPLHAVCVQSYDGLNVISLEEHLKIAESLIEYGAAVNATNADGNTPLHLCCDNIRMTLLLLAKGAYFAQKNNKSQTPADCSRNFQVRAILKNESIVKEKLAEIEEKIHEIIMRNDSAIAQKNIFNFIDRRQKQSMPSYKTTDLYLYTQAILELTQDLTREKIREYMAYEEDETMFFDDLIINA